ncbi:hypothetical protein KIL84_007697 [Mauremys mutica]|uniref:Uncharacterized protein n=1 Tax=Mauremys mutica TaxID=74926 RepID=A0A9D4AVV3_9SAUR|nr:hypothetical protein KIL84_007697 [Mauremys mutica]
MAPRATYPTCRCSLIFPVAPPRLIYTSPLLQKASSCLTLHRNATTVKAGNEEEAHIQLELYRIGRMYIITQIGTCLGHLGSIPDSGEKCQEISDKHMWSRASFLDTQLKDRQNYCFVGCLQPIQTKGINSGWQWPKDTT